MKKVLLAVIVMIVGVLHSVQAQNNCSTCGGKPKEKKKTEQSKNNPQADPPKKGKECGKEPNKAKELCPNCEVTSLSLSMMEVPYDGYIRLNWFTKGPCTKFPVLSNLPAGVGYVILYDDNNVPYANIGPFKGVGGNIKVIFNDVNTGAPVPREMPIVAQPKPQTVDSSAYLAESSEDDRTWIQRNGGWFWPVAIVVVGGTGSLIVHNNPEIFCHLFDRNRDHEDKKDDPLNNSTGQTGVNGHDPGGPKPGRTDDEPKDRYRQTATPVAKQGLVFTF